MSKSIRQHLADLSGNSVRGLDYSKLASNFGRLARQKHEQDLRNEMERERVVALDEPHVDMLRRAIEEAIEKESADVNGNLPVISVFEASQMAKSASKRSSRDVGLTNLVTHLERRWKADKEAHLSASDILTLKDHYSRNFPKSAAKSVVDSFCKEGYLDLPVGHLMEIASQIRSQSDFDYYIKEAGLQTNNPYNKKARQFILALLNGKVAEDEDEWEDEDDDEDDEDLNPTIYLDNMDKHDGTVSVHVSEPGAGEWADNDGSIMGSNWETDGPDFAYAIIMDEPGLVSKLEGEGYEVDDSEYSGMDEEEWEELGQEFEQERFDEKQMKLPGVKGRRARRLAQGGKTFYVGSDWPRVCKRLAQGDKPFQVGVTYEIWDEESVEIGDTDERGWEVEKEPADLLDIADYVDKYGPFNEASSYPSQPGDWWSHYDAEDNFETGDKTDYSIFVEYNDGSTLDQRDFEMISKIVSGEMSWSEVNDMMDPDNEEAEPYQPSDPRQMKLPNIARRRSRLVRG